MAHSWDQLGEIASVAQLTGVDAVKLIGMIVTAANTARMHKKNCRQFAQHLKLIGNLLEQLKISEMKKTRPEVQEPLEGLEDALRRSYLLVNSCQDKSYLYLLAMGWNIVYQFRKAQDEIDRYLKIIPLITLVDNVRVRERLEVIDSDQREYTLDEEDRKVQDVILKQESTREAAASVLKKTLSRSYPEMGFCEALKTENGKLQVELQRSRARYDTDQCQVIQRLIAVTETVDDEPVKDDSYDAVYPKKSSTRGLESSQHQEEWHTDLLDCCSEPTLCLKTFFFPCDTLAKISTVATNKQISKESYMRADSFVILVSTNLIQKLLFQLQVKLVGGSIDDFLSHLMCCCCALVQELREVEIRGASYETEKKKMKNMTPPLPQFMEE
ncbi:hypothetical protein F2Q70_00000976 [Brassica cretica]|uniref:MCAfunc domain-containing protein n=1 Tax=Brassica cretica TaxID=69181 RepID=A0A8S9IKS1_BRACR|nr:hypothetical protein F2Q70_00000976 [Brassica cretica]